jgi:hypothetical protein
LLAEDSFPEDPLVHGPRPYAMKKIESVLASLLVAVAAGGGSGKVH